MDLTDLDAVRKAMKPNTKVIYCESRRTHHGHRRPCGALGDRPQERGHGHGGQHHCSPVVQRLHRVRCRCGASSQNISTDMATSSPVWSWEEDINRVKQEGLKDMTGPPCPNYLLLRGMKTLHIRVPRHCETAMQVARFWRGVR